ncbi:hypothetical protein RvY_18491-2 [Ramazzottius varieornatus]|nr:hypothetical protein RvY_18491-2 [Ramazzottius varieornatus]
MKATSYVVQVLHSYHPVPLSFGPTPCPINCREYYIIGRLVAIISLHGRSGCILPAITACAVLIPNDALQTASITPSITSGTLMVKSEVVSHLLLAVDSSAEETQSARKMATLTTLTVAAFSLINPLLNIPSNTLSLSTLESFTLSTRPVTDIWRKPPGGGSSVPLIDNLNAPCYVATIPLTAFRRARVTLDANWTRLYDQGGLVFLYPPPSKDSSAKRAWIKTGVEVFNGMANVATVATAATSHSDWSLLPLADGKATLTIELRREEIDVAKGKGSTMFVYMIDGVKETMVRETAWAFAEENGDVQIGVYAARPTKSNEGEEDILQVTFSNLVVEYLSG